MIYYEVTETVEGMTVCNGQIVYHLIAGELFTTKEIKATFLHDEVLAEIARDYFIVREIPSQKVRHVFGRRVQIN